MSVNKESPGMVKLLLQHKSDANAKNNVSPGDNGVRVWLWDIYWCKGMAVGIYCKGVSVGIYC